MRSRLARLAALAMSASTACTGGHPSTGAATDSRAMVVTVGADGSSDAEPDSSDAQSTLADAGSPSYCSSSRGPLSASEAADADDAVLCPCQPQDGEFCPGGATGARCIQDPASGLTLGGEAGPAPWRCVETVP
jgi:hypothetical protein